jgi:hypothetical protein
MPTQIGRSEALISSVSTLVAYGVVDVLGA